MSICFYSDDVMIMNFDIYYEFLNNRHFLNKFKQQTKTMMAHTVSTLSTYLSLRLDPSQVINTSLESMNSAPATCVNASALPEASFSLHKGVS